MQFLEPIVRHAGEQMVRQMVVLPQRKDGELDKRIDEEDARVGQPAAVAVAVLHELAQDHEERKRREDRHQPQQQIISAAYGVTQAQPGQAAEDQGDT